MISNPKITKDSKPVGPDFVLDGTLRNRKLFDASYTDCNDITWCDDCCAAVCGKFKIKLLAV
jgi:hypothetical protein